MNIIVSPYGKESFYCRPDSTLIRALDEYYIPDQVEKISVVPVMYIKTLRAGKAIANRFAQRYIDSYGFGLLIHPTLKGEYFTGQQERAFIENSLDYTSIIPLLSFPEMEIPAANTHKFEVQINYRNPFDKFIFPSYDGIMERISLISRYCSLRIGDFITMELATPVEIAPVSRLTGSVDGEQIFNFVVK